jgi:predicted alpha/beta-hydrolase family hydrolase
MNSFSIALDTAGSVTAIAYRPPLPSSATLILAHGAGADQHSPFMVQFAQAMAERNITAITFNFPYKEQQRKIPDRRPVLDDCYRRVVERVRGEIGGDNATRIIGGKSMGGRIATHIAASDANLPIDGLVLLGYPLHPPGRPDQPRDAHLPDIRKPMLIVQGSRDTFGTPSELAPVLSRMNPTPALHVIDGGDHSFKVSKGGAEGQRQTMATIYDRVAAWIKDGAARSR